MNKRVKWIIITICMSPCLVIQAQQKEVGDIQTEFNVIWGLAQNDFEENIDRPMMGFVFSFGGRTPELPLVLSTEIGWLNYGFDNHLEFQWPGDNVTPISVVDVATKNSIFMTHAIVRVVPYEGKITPYVSGLIGFKYLSTNIEIESEALFDEDGVIIIRGDDEILTSSTYNSMALSYGLGAGVSIRIFNGSLGFHNPKSTISLHAGVQYLLGSEADYLTENPIITEEGGIRFELVESDTDILVPKFGFIVGI